MYASDTYCNDDHERYQGKWKRTRGLHDKTPAPQLPRITQSANTRGQFDHQSIATAYPRKPFPIHQPRRSVHPPLQSTSVAPASTRANPSRSIHAPAPYLIPASNAPPRPSHSSHIPHPSHPHRPSSRTKSPSTPQLPRPAPTSASSPNTCCRCVYRCCCPKRF